MNWFILAHLSHFKTRASYLFCIRYSSVIYKLFKFLHSWELFLVWIKIPARYIFSFRNCARKVWSSYGNDQHWTCWGSLPESDLTRYLATQYEVRTNHLLYNLLCIRLPPFTGSLHLLSTLKTCYLQCKLLIYFTLC